MKLSLGGHGLGCVYEILRKQLVFVMYLFLFECPAALIERTWLCELRSCLGVVDEESVCNFRGTIRDAH